MAVIGKCSECGKKKVRLRIRDNGDRLCSECFLTKVKNPSHRRYNTKRRAKSKAYVVNGVPLPKNPCPNCGGPMGVRIKGVCEHCYRHQNKKYEDYNLHFNYHNDPKIQAEIEKGIQYATGHKRCRTCKHEIHSRNWGSKGNHQWYCNRHGCFVLPDILCDCDGDEWWEPKEKELPFIIYNEGE